MTSKEVTPRRAQRRAVGRIIQKLQHAVPGLVLFQHGWHAIAAGEHGWHLALGVAELVTSAAVAVSLVLAIRHVVSHVRAGTAPHLHTGIDWADIFLGLMLFTEVAAKYPVHHKIWSPTCLLAIVMIVLGLWGGKIAEWKIKKGLKRA
jgi:hypothetical protein